LHGETFAQPSDFVTPAKAGVQETFFCRHDGRELCKGLTAFVESKEDQALIRKDNEIIGKVIRRLVMPPVHN